MDGTTVTGVLMADTQVSATFDGTGATTSDRVRSIVKDAGSPARVRVALAQAGTVASEMTVTSAMADRTVFRAAAHDRTGTHELSAVVAGMFDLDQLVDGTTAPCVVLATARAAVDDLYECVGTVDAQVVSTPACAAAVEGLTLALRDANTELTLVLGGRLRASRELRTGGLRTLDEALGQGSVVGGTRLTAALRARSADHVRVDPEAVSELRRYLRAVAAEVAATVSEWSLAGHDVSRRIYAHGPGASASDLTAALADAGFTRHTANNLEAALACLEPRARPRMVDAYLAAQTYTTDQPAQVYPNPRALKVARSDAARRHRVRRTRAACSALALVAGGALLPLATSHVAHVRDARALSAEIEQTAQLLGVPAAQVRVALDQQRDQGVVDVATAARAEEVLRAHGTLERLDAGPAGVAAQLSGVTDPAAALDDLAASGFQVADSTYEPAPARLAVTVHLGGSR